MFDYFINLSFLSTARTLILSLGLVIVAIGVTLYVSILHSGYTILYLVCGATLLLIILVQKVKPDISKRKKSEQKLKALLAGAPDATVIVNQKALIDIVNIQIDRFFGSNRIEYIGQPVELLKPGHVRNGMNIFKPVVMKLTVSPQASRKII